MPLQYVQTTTAMGLRLVLIGYTLGVVGCSSGIIDSPNYAVAASAQVKSKSTPASKAATKTAKKSKPQTKAKAVQPAKPSAAPQPTVPAARDPQIAVQEEFDAAKQKGSLAGWDLFIARHGDNLLAAAARAERAKMDGTATPLQK